MDESVSSCSVETQSPDERIPAPRGTKENLSVTSNRYVWRGDLNEVSRESRNSEGREVTARAPGGNYHLVPFNPQLSALSMQLIVGDERFRKKEKGKKEKGREGDVPTSVSDLLREESTGKSGALVAPCSSDTRHEIAKETFPRCRRRDSDTSALVPPS